MSKDRDDAKNPVGPYDVDRLGGDSVLGSEGGGGWSGGGTGTAPESDASLIEKPLDGKDEAEGEIDDEE